MLREFFEKYQIGDAAVAAGVSGGADSLALLFQLDAFLRPQGRRVIALTVDHGLRPESRDEAEYVAKLAAERQIEHHILTWEGKKPEKGIEEAARTARYGLLCGWCRDNGVGTLAVAHHLLDQAETFFMRLQRGSGLNGLCGMAPLSEKNGVRLIRPFLQVHPERLKEFLRERGVSWAEDPFNRCDDYLRVRVRKFLPQLAATLAQFTARYDAHKEDKTAPYPGIPELLAALKAEGIQTAVFSNKADAFCGKIIEHYFGPGSFSLVRGSRPGVPTKPDPAGVYSLMADLGADPQSTLFVGDSDVDILTGHNAGLPALGVLWGFRGEAELTAAGADALAAKPEDILTYLHQH